MHVQTLMGLTPEQSACSFSNDELYMLAFGNTPEANAFRELLAWRQREQQASGTGQSVALQPA